MVPIVRRKNRNFFRVVGMTFLLSLFIECIQLIFRVGSFDVDDLILNTLGGLIGYVIFWLMNRIRRRWLVK
ncbi:MAG: VanZ family protein [Frisingicoccus sp.]